VADLVEPNRLVSDMPNLLNKNDLTQYTFVGAPRFYNEGDAYGWHFISFPRGLAKEVRDNHKLQEEGWGRMKAIARIGGSEWSTAIWFDTKNDTYLLPVKAEIRRKEGVVIGQDIDVAVWV